MKSHVFILLVSFFLMGCTANEDKQGVLYLLNLSSCEHIKIESKSGKEMIINKGGYFDGLIYFASVYGIWGSNHYHYGIEHCVIENPEVAIITIDDKNHILNDSLSKSFALLSSYKKFVEERDIFVYEMDDDFVKMVSALPIIQP